MPPKSHLSRRNVILTLTKAGLAATAGVSLFNYLRTDFKPGQQTGATLLGAKFRSVAGPNAGGYLDHSLFTENSFFRLDLLSGKLSEAVSETPAHSTQPHPLDNKLVSCVPKRSNRMNLFDWTTNREIAAFVASDPRQFLYGHTAFTDDGTQMLVPGVEHKEGKLYVFDVPSLRMANSVSLGYRITIHDIVSIGAGLFVCGVATDECDTVNFGIFDIKTGTFKIFSKQVQTIGQQHLSTNHLKLAGGVVYGTGNNLVNQVYTDGFMAKFNVEDQKIDLICPVGSYNLLHEVLSVEFDPATGYVWFTVPESKFLLVWDAKNDNLVSVLNFESYAYSVTLAESVDAMIVGTANRLVAVDRKSIKKRHNLSEKWSALSVTGFRTPHTRIV